MWGVHCTAAVGSNILEESSGNAEIWWTAQWSHRSQYHFLLNPPLPPRLGPTSFSGRLSLGRYPTSTSPLPLSTPMTDRGALVWTLKKSNRIKCETKLFFLLTRRVYTLFKLDWHSERGCCFFKWRAVYNILSERNHRKCLVSINTRVSSVQCTMHVC